MFFRPMLKAVGMNLSFVGASGGGGTGEGVETAHVGEHGSVADQIFHVTQMVKGLVEFLKGLGITGVIFILGLLGIKITKGVITRRKNGKPK